MAGRHCDRHNATVNLRQATSKTTLVLSTLLASWLGMQAVRELGHVVGAMLTGGTVERVVLHPLTISRTDLAANPRPLLVVWAGPIIGVTLPLILWGAAATLGVAEAFLLRFFAGFCLVANGLYIGAGSYDRVGDCGEMLRHGSPIWSLWLFGLLTVPAGFALWHGQAKHFGLGQHGELPSRTVVALSIATCLTLLLVGLMFG